MRFKWIFPRLALNLLIINDKKHDGNHFSKIAKIDFLFKKQPIWSSHWISFSRIFTYLYLKHTSL